MRTTAIALQIAAATLLLAGGADARVRIRTALAPTPIAGSATGQARLSVMDFSDGRFEVVLRGLSPDTVYELVVGDVRVADLPTNSRGRARARFRTRPRRHDLPLGFDPRGATVVVRDASGADVLVASLPQAPTTDDSGDLVCCIPDDSGPECEDRTQAECDAQGGTVIAGATSCLPNPCTGAPPVGGGTDVVCCLPDDSGPECEDRTQAECLAGGGVVVSATSCVPEPCAPIPPPGGEVICCLPDTGGDGAMECEDLTADACGAAGGVVSGATSCTPNPCGTGGGGGGGVPALRVTCERRSNRSKISVDGSNLASGSYRARVQSGSESATSPAAPTVGDEVEFDFDSDPGDIAAGATAIDAGFIQGTPPQVTGALLDDGGSVLVESTVTCTQN